MNNLEKKSFYSFLLLYLGSSLIFVFLSAYWYYSAQKNSLDSTVYYKLQNLANTISSLIVDAHMNKTPLKLPETQNNYEYMLIKSSQNKTFEKSYFEKDGFKILASSAPHKHLAIEYVVVKTDEYNKELKYLHNRVFTISAMIIVSMIFISWLLSRLFMRPIHQKVKEIENFVRDISHELNTPITALGMSTKRGVQKGVYDEKIFRNISISTKQLYSIYQSLTYLNFSERKEDSFRINLKPILQRSIEFYSELTYAKNIKIETKLDDSYLKSIDTRVELLFSNLLSNAIKYSMPDTTIKIILREGFFSIEDEGVGIEKSKIDKIFELYTRGSNLAGGFGVGLSVVKQICDEFGIEIDVTSQLGEGTIFELKWEF